MILFEKNKCLIFTVLLSLFLGFNMSAQKIVLSNAAEVQSITSGLYIYEDKGNELTIKDILEEKIDKQFKKTDQQTPSFSFTSSAIWCKFKLAAKSKNEYFLEIDPPILNEIVLYSVSENGDVDSIRRGSLYLSRNQGISSSNFIFKLDKHSAVFYLKIKTTTRLFINANIGTDRAFLLKNSNSDLIKGSYCGILLMIFLYNLFLLLTTRDRIYLYYLFHLINAAMNFLYLSGLGKEYIWVENTWVNEYIISVMSLGFVLPILFTINFLDTKVHSKRLHQGMILSIFVLILIFVVDISGWHLLSGKLINIVGFLIILFVIFSTIVIKKRGYKPAKPFLYAWMFYFAGIIVQVLQGLNIIPTYALTANAMQIGAVFEIIILSLAIGYKINYLKNNMKLSIAGEKEALKEKEQMISQQSEELETLAQKQSIQIHDQNLKLKEKDASITKQNEQIKIQNTKLLESNKLLENKSLIANEQNESLIFHKNNLEELIELRTFELEKATRKAEEADRSKTAFLKNVSHEIRTPMNAMAGFASLLFDIDKKDKRHAYYVDIITKNTDDLLNLIDNIIELSRIQTGNVKIKYVTFDPQKIFKALNDLFVEKMKDERKSFVSLKLAVPDDDNIQIRTDYNRFWQILFHLLDNAIKYTETGFVQFGYDVLTENNEPPSFQLFVKDTGKGIPSEKLRTVFDRFRKNEEGKTKLYAGTGLGLSLVKGLTEFMNGTISVDTKTKKEFPAEASGTTFTVVFKDVIVE